MNSPDPGSPISTDTSGSPPPDDFQFSNREQQQIMSAADSRLPSNTSATPAPSSSKRRLPGGSSSEGVQRRDPKTRKREDARGSAIGSRRAIEGQTGHMAGSPFGLGGNTLQSRGEYISRRDKDDLIDLPLVEQLRQGRSRWRLSISSSLHASPLSVRFRRSILGF